MTEALNQAGNSSDEKLVALQKDLGVLTGDVNKKIDIILQKQDENRQLLEQSVGNLESQAPHAAPMHIDAQALIHDMKQQIIQQFGMAASQNIADVEESKQKDETYERQLQVANDILDRKYDRQWISAQARFSISGKYAFSVLTNQELVFVDGNQGNIEVLNKGDLTLIGTINTDNSPALSI